MSRLADPRLKVAQQSATHVTMCPMKAALVAALAACGSSSPTTPHDAAPTTDSAPARDATITTPSGHWLLAYYVGYQIDKLPIANIPWGSLTHLAMSPMVVAVDGTPDLSFDDSHGTGEADARAVATAARAHGVVPLLMLGGANAGVNILAAAKPANVAAFVTKLLAAMDQLGYAGIDLDWEDSVDLDEFIALAQGLRAARPSIVLTYPAGMINGNFQTVDPKVATLAQSLDQFNVQTYYPSTAVVGQGWDSWFLAPLGGHTGATPIDATDTLSRYAAAGVPKGKLGIGVGAYAICYSPGITAPHQPTTGSTKISGGDNDFPLSAFYAKDGFYATHTSAAHYDTDAHQPYLSFATPVTDAHCGQTQYVSYESHQSLSDKGAYVLAQGYGGVIVWTLAEMMVPADAVEGGGPALLTSLGGALLSPGP